MEDQPYDFIDSTAPEKRKTTRKMEKSAEEGELFGGNSNSCSSNNNREGTNREGTTTEETDNPAGSDSPFLLQVLNKLFKLFE